MSWQLSKILNPSDLFFKVFAQILNQLDLKSLWMTFAATLGKHLMIAASANMFYVAIDYMNKTYMEVAVTK